VYPMLQMINFVVFNITAMKVSFYLKNVDATEPTPIFARVSYFGLQLKYYPSINIAPKFWNKDTQRARETQKFIGYSNFNRRLDDITRDAEDMLTDFQNRNNGAIPAPKELKGLLDIKLKDIATKQDKHSLVSYFQKVIDDSKKGMRINVSTKRPVTPGTIKTYVNTQNILNEFIAFKKKKVDFDNIDLDFYADFTNYLQKVKKHSVNSIGKQIKIIKTILNEATEDGANTNLAYKSKRFIRVEEKVDNIYLNDNELIKLGNLDLTQEPKYERVRDLFLVGCYTGLRFSDFSILRPDQIQDGFIETTQIKTGEAVVIPIHEKVEQILQKYNGVLPKAISNQKTNDYLKEIAKKLPELKERTSIAVNIQGQKTIQNIEKWNLVSTHTARRSFATNEFKAGTPTLTIMAITGHKTERAFLKYIKVTPKEHAQILKLAWQNRRKTKVIALTA
jgi:integrase